MADTNIEWTDRVWNPTRGCSRITEGCRNCYAERMAIRLSGPGRPYHGLVRSTGHGPVWTGKVVLDPEKLVEPLGWKRPGSVFVNSMSDLFHEALTNEQIAAVFGVMSLASDQTFQVLTKRAERLPQWFAWVTDTNNPWGDNPWDVVQLCLASIIGEEKAERWMPDQTFAEEEAWPLPNVWIGVSVERQEEAEERVPHLLRVPAVVRFLSCEPLLGRLDLDRGRCEDHNRDHVAVNEQGEFCNECAADGWSGELSSGHWLDPCADEEQAGINWVIVGGESGHGARPCALEWIERLVKQCRRRDVPVFVKQLGAVVVSEERTAPDDVMALHGMDKAACDRMRAPSGEVWAWRDGLADKKGGNMKEWPPHLQVREFPRLDGVRDA